MSEDLWRRGAGELAQLIAAREVSSREVVQAHLDRIEAVNPHLNAVVLVLADEALAAADAADAASAGGPLHGVPFTVKENIDVAGTPTTSGVPALAEAVSPIDAPQVERLRAAGAIPIARTNLPDLGLRIHTDSSLRGLTRNPWDPDVTAGGSSGGEASALASGMSPLGLGNDVGGSLRNPAHCCGIASIKPTPGRVPHATVIPPEDMGPGMQFMAVEGVMARRVGDVRLGLSIVCGMSPRDPESVPVPLDVPRPESRRVALLAEPPGGDTHPEIAAAVRRAGDALADAGYEVVEAEPPAYEQVLDVWGRFLFNDIRAQEEILRAVMGPDAIRFLDHIGVLYDDLDAAGVVATLVERRALGRAWNAFLETHPLILSPIWSQPPFPHGWDAASPENSKATMELMRPVMPANLLGLPAAAVNAGKAAGLPAGVQVMGARFQDLACLEAAEAIETRLGVAEAIDPVLATART
ncbi:amidase [Solirubrobacter soli]|uniref:amidase n=1 Tax=Solirubrobacter soli TaxID=363832 RepID=UPI000422BF14|nr:amidase [Solirubrobacter soli]